jgi:hypothetical protein
LDRYLSVFGNTLTLKHRFPSTASQGPNFEQMHLQSKMADAAAAPRESRTDKILIRHDHIKKIVPHLAILFTSKSIVQKQNTEHQRLTELKRNSREFEAFC